jgi:hypothetical protein
MGYEVRRRDKPRSPEAILPHGVVEPEFKRIHDIARPFTMTTALGMHNLWTSMQWVIDNDLPGDIVECGVWRGGSAMIVAQSLLALGDSKRKIYLYDTYEGMPSSVDKDLSFKGQSATEIEANVIKEDGKRWLEASIEEVHKNVLSTGFPEDRLVLVRGMVEDTIPGTIPDQICLLRLDTDFYESTLHELEHLYPRLVQRGILILDDYDFWKGARSAVSEYFKEKSIRIFLSRMDVGRIAVKL